MTRRELLAWLAVTPAAALVGCKRTGEIPWLDKPGPRVVVTFAPLHSFATSVMGGHGQVRTILATTGPHDYQPTSDDARLIDGADVFFHNGLGLEGNLVRTIRKARTGTKVVFVDLGAKLDEKTLLQAEEHDHDHGAHGHTHDHEFDPHVWLGIDNAKRMVELIRDELKKIDSSHAAEYDKNAAACIASFEQLKEEGRSLLADVPKENRKFVTMHDSLGYFAKTFDLKIAGVIELTPGQEPSARQLGALVEACTKDKVRVIALEPQYSSAGGAKTLERELKKRNLSPVIIAIDPLETATTDELAADLYVKTMRSNLKALAEALKQP
jgi:ABC-type Zn uptake system ZnuABC Zn-binding protein ZnuA